MREAGHLPGTVKSQQTAQLVGSPTNASQLCPISKHLHIPYHRSSQSTQRDSNSLQSNSWLMIRDRIQLGTSTSDPVLFLQAASYLIPPTNAQFIEFGDALATTCCSLNSKVYLALNSTHTHTFEKLCAYIFVSQICT